MGIFADHQLQALPGADAVGWPGLGFHSKALLISGINLDKY